MEQDTSICVSVNILPVPWKTDGYIILALPWENLSSGFATRMDSNRPAQSQKLGRGLKFREQNVEVLYYL